MKLSSIIKYSIDSLMRKFFKSMAIILLFAFSFVLIAMCIIPNILTAYTSKSVDRVLSAGIKRTGTIHIKEYNDNCEEFVGKLKNIEGIEAVGEVSLTENNNKELRELRSIQKNHIPDELVFEDGSLQTNNGLIIMHFNYEAWEIHNLKLSKGSYATSDESGEIPTVNIYLGNAYKDIPIGTEYVMGREPHIYKYKVMGILEKGAKCTTDNLTYEGFDNPKTINLDYLVIAVHSSGIQSENLFTITDKADMQEVINRIYELAKEYDIGVTVGSLEGLFEEDKKSYGKISDLLLELMLVVVLVSATIQACVQITDIIGRFRMYGILYSNGATKTDIYLIVIIENVVRYILACIIFYGAARLLLRSLFSNAAAYKLVTEIFHNDVLVPVYLIGLTVCMASIVVPLLMIRKKSPVELVINSAAK